MYRIALHDGTEEKIVLIGDKFKGEIINIVKEFLNNTEFNAKYIKISKAGN